MSTSRRALRLALVVPSLGCGGAERVAVTLADGFVRHGHRVSLVTLSGGTDDFFPVPSGVHRIGLDREARGTSVLRNAVTSLGQVAALRTTLAHQQPDVVLSFMSATNVLSSLAVLGTSVPVIATEHNPRGLPPLGPIWGPLQRLAYLSVSRVVSVSHAIDAGYRWVPTRRRAVIYNPLGSRMTSVSGDPERVGARRTVITVGRLVQVKGYDTLLRAFSRIANSRDAWDLMIVGEGPERAMLEQLRDALDLQGRVHFTGVISDVSPWLARSDVFVSSTRTGGVGCAAMEALAAGVPVIATVRPGIPAEVIHDGFNGLRVVVDDIDAMAAAMSRLMDDDILRRTYATQAHAAVDALDVTSIVSAWETLFDDVLHGLRAT